MQCYLPDDATEQIFVEFDDEVLVTQKTLSIDEEILQAISKNGSVSEEKKDQEKKKRRRFSSQILRRFKSLLICR